MTLAAQTPDTSPAILAASGVTKRFGGVVALSEAHVDVRRQEVHVIVGDNGAGKSTLFKILVGAVQPDAGYVLVDGQPVDMSGPEVARQYGIATVFQDLALVNHLDVAANLFLGREIMKAGLLGRLGFLDKRAMRRQAVADIRRMQVNVRSTDQLLMGMSGGQRQAIAVARAVSFGTRIVGMDEPTAALGVRETAAVLQLIKDVRAEGLSVLMISHSLPDVFEVADRITIMRLGRNVATVSRDEVTLQDIVGMMTGAQDWREAQAPSGAE